MVVRLGWPGPPGAQAAAAAPAGDAGYVLSARRHACQSRGRSVCELSPAVLAETVAPMRARGPAGVQGGRAQKHQAEAALPAPRASARTHPHACQSTTGAALAGWTQVFAGATWGVHAETDTSSARAHARSRQIRDAPVPGHNNAHLVGFDLHS